MPLHRRTFLHSTALAASATYLATQTTAEEPSALIVDVHQHLWDLKKLKLPWLESAPEILRHTYHEAEYAEATQGLRMQSVYMEVDVAPEQLPKEAEHVIELAKSGQYPTVAAVIGSRPESREFAGYVQRFASVPQVKGMRRVLHVPETPSGFCLEEQFVKSMRLLGEKKLSFDLCMRPTDLGDALKLTELCPETRFIVDHCGNADPLAFRRQSSEDTKPAHTATEWKSAMEKLAKRPNTLCKISGVIARLPKGGTAEDLAPIINHCLDAFGPDRVVFGSDWPVCLLGAPLKTWIRMLTEIISTRPEADRRKLWSENAIKHYALAAKQ